MASYVPPRRLLVAATLVGIASLSSACPGDFHSPTEPFHERIDRVVTLAVGDEARLRPGLSLSLDRIVSDSRCPTGAVCVWEGEVVVALTLRPGDEHLPFVVSDHATKVTVGRYDVTLLMVTPHPRLDDPLRPGEYRVTVWVYSNDAR